MHLRSLLDHGKFCWFHALNDTATFDRVGAEHTIFQAVQMHRVDLTLATLNRMLDTRGQRTKYPCQVFYKLLPPSDVPLVVSTLSAYCVSIPRLVVTPLRQFFIGVETEMSNRVIRRYTARPQFSVESFLRVQVSDEDGRNLFDRDLTRDVETRIKSALVNGVSICGRAYKFLAYSSSQLKDSSLWMVHLPPGWSVQAIRNELGDFDSCKIPSKYAARIGQCFSTTVEGLPSRECAGNLLQPSVRHAIIDDIESQHAGRKMCHSDGNGLIRRDAMDQLLKRVVFAPTDTRDASIVQVRYAGAKGTLTAWTAVDDDRLSNSDVLVRNSMIKFDAPYDQLEVVKVGAHVGYHLNRNVIFLLQAHGVPEYTILDMQRSMLDDLDEMLTCRQKALQMLPSLSGPDSAQRATLLHMLHSGMSPTSEPVLLDTLTGIRSHHLYCLRKKARIFVKKGAVLMGGLDVTGLLLEGCVFVQLRRASLRGASEESGTQNAYEPIVGPVLVTKHPVMHPGDVRMMLAVDIPELRDHRNAILFSQQGSRPAADMMSGSDLDGDEFAVTFDERLFLRGWNGCRKEEDGQFVSTSGIRLSLDDPERAARILQDTNDVAMDFDVNESSSSSTVPPNLPAEDDARSEALIEHFFGHIKLASVGRICMMWLDYASVSPDGGRCAECLTLAHLHSVAVDYPKSGVPAEIPRDLFWPRSRPRAHWREMKGGSFDCESTVGKLYDEVIRRARNSLPAQSSKALAGRAINKYGQVVCFAAGDKVENHLHEVYNPRIPFLLLGTHISTGIQRFALEQRRGYESDVSQLINKYKLSSEGELLTGCIRKYHKLNKKRSHQFAEDVRRQSRELRRKYRSAFFQKVLKIVDVDWSKNRPTAESHADDALHELASDMGRTTSTAEQDDASVDLDASSSDDDLLVDQDDCEEEDEEPDEELLKWVKDLATSRDVSRNGSTREAFARGTAQQLAAAYYMATYSPALRFGGRDRRLALFSFPWVVADVIAFGMLEAESSSEPE
jgi:RNA-dependent RNA polymerase